MANTRVHFRVHTPSPNHGYPHLRFGAGSERDSPLHDGSQVLHKRSPDRNHGEHLAAGPVWGPRFNATLSGLQQRHMDAQS